MYRIREAARLTGVSEATLRAWERRYGVVAPARTEAGYRIYDADALAVLSAMRRLVEAGWSPGQAALAVRRGGTGVPPVSPGRDEGPTDEQSEARALTSRFLQSAAAMDVAGTEQSLDGAFALGTFEHVVDAWLFPALRALGEEWARGGIDVAAEHAASHAVHRRLAAAFEAAGSGSRGAAVVVGLPPDSFHELGALAFATAMRRLGHDVLYLGADVPASSWVAAVRGHDARGAVIGVVTENDRAPAAEVAELLVTARSEVLVATGGPAGQGLGAHTRSLSPSIASAASQLDRLLWSPPR